jgi:hypothetical protein
MLSLILLDPESLITWLWRQSTMLQIAMARWGNVFICAICQAIVLDFWEMSTMEACQHMKLPNQYLNDPHYRVVAKPEIN